MRTVIKNPEISSKDLQHVAADQCHCASFNSAHFAQEIAVWESNAEEAFSAQIPQSHLRYARTHLGKPNSFWNKVLWTDGTKIEYDGITCMMNII